MLSKVSKELDEVVEGLVFTDLDDEPDTYSASVYGSKYAAMELPRHEMPEKEMPKEVAYRMIHDDLSLDGTPSLNLASFVTTWMEDEAEKLMTEALSKNFIDYEEYPVSADIQARCVSMIGRLFNIPENGGAEPMGTSTVGSSEAIILGILAMKKVWQNKRKAEGKPYDKPNMVMSAAVQVCWEKGCRYLDVEEKFVYCTENRFVLDPVQTVDACDENTIGICVILGTTYTGEYEDAKAINDLLVERGMDVPIHIDAASGGFVAPFIVPDLEWDFRLPMVRSINVSGHKYGLCYPGIGWVIWRDPKDLPQELVFNINYLGADQASFTLNFSKSASNVISQYYQLIRLGKHGYKTIMYNITRTADIISDALEKMGFIILSEKGGRGLPLVAFRIDPKKGYKYDEFALAHQLRERGWIIPAYTMAPNSGAMKLMRIVVREDFSRARCKALLVDFSLALKTLGAMDAKKLDEHRTHIALNAVNRWKLGMRKPNDHFADEEHSLKGKTGKSHPVC